MTHHTANPQQQQQQPAPGARKASGAEQKAMTPQQREQAWKLVYRTTHPDFKGRLADGTESMLSWAGFGSGLVSLATISDAELIERLRFANAGRGE